MKKRFKFKKLRLNFFRAGALSKNKSALLFFSVVLVLTIWLTWAILSTGRINDTQDDSIQKIEANSNKEAYKTITVTVNSSDLLSSNASENENLIINNNPINNDLIKIKQLDLPWAFKEMIVPEIETLATKTILKDDSSIAQAGTLLFQKQIQKENEEQIKQKKVIIPQKTTEPEQKISSNKNAKSDTGKKEMKIAPKKTVAPKTSYSVQLGSFLSKDNADELVNKLKSSGESAFIIKGTVDNKTWFRVMSGQLDSEKKAQEHEKELIAKKIISKNGTGRIKKLTK